MPAKGKNEPGSRAYEKNKSLKKRRAPPRRSDDPEGKPESEEENSGSEEGGEKNEETTKEVGKLSLDKEEPGSEEEEEEGEEEEVDEEGKKKEGWKTHRIQDPKKKGTETLGIEIENPNRQKKAHIKPSELATLKVEPTRKDREAIEKTKDAKKSRK